ncbi:hypothetical protein PG993_005650 [Apiospora rasikravindrae]|uniref:Uncharacterized protein n=1 Tax=Apiospora rasikravindrae TaxID=990691 RepID=A0ABR1TG51_9PEZI
MEIAKYRRRSSGIGKSGGGGGGSSDDDDYGIAEEGSGRVSAASKPYLIAPREAIVVRAYIDKE